MSDSSGLFKSILRFVESWGADGDFDSLALSLFARQYEQNLPYRRFCDAHSLTPATVKHWRQAPAAPAAAFRTQRLTCSDAPYAAIFRTSGTTGGAGSRGSHFMDAMALALYQESLGASFRHLACRAAELPIRALIAPWSRARSSSLSCMISTLARTAPGRARYFWKDGGPDIPAAALELSRYKRPVLLYTTAFALLELLAWPCHPLHHGSIIIETGGFKGRARTLDRDALYQAASRRFSLPLSSIGSEYGMCEMASQFYDRNLGETAPAAESPDTGAIGMPPAIKIGPPWVRTQLIDPGAGRPAEPGQPGILRHFDLCNLNSVAAIQTLDLGLPAEDGFVLLGRLPGALPRGCSLTVEEWMERTTQAAGSRQ